MLSGNNAGRFNGVKIDPNKIETKIFQWDSKTGRFMAN